MSLERRTVSVAPIAAVLLAVACGLLRDPGAEAGPAGAARARAGRSAVLFIGDGMGPAYVTATRVARGGSAGRLHLDAMPYTALVRTWSADGPVTDSAAAATAMACGEKTVNGVLCEDRSALYGRRDGRRLEPLAMWAARRGIRVGIVTTARATHATPAAFYAVQKDRDAERDIARQAIEAPLDLLLGGGRSFFLPRPPAREESGWSPSDAADLEAAARSKGWTIVTSAEDLRRTPASRGRVLGLFAGSHLPYETPGASRTAPTLVEMTRFAIIRLKATGDPFFLMVEGGRIDHAGHANWARTLIDETAAFDDALGAALGMLDPKTTLVLATADHETGGLAINGYPDEAAGILSTVSPEGGGEAYPVLTFASGQGTKGSSGEAPPHGAEDPRPSAVPLGSAAHTGVDVALYAWGAGSEKVHGTLDNTAVHALLRAQLERRPGSGQTARQRP